uniref:Non-specific protein-tyrosine kinase n=1 Tax=Paramoeba aestuarina TaxID=180227 RepID=A0A7S4JUB0_9EUKA|mmetsp:Transcript_12922/g.19871  ORF Transcript_12922/g.19871 Transcript_12922/m.19871 type:complete len:601 (+) Transcript_12922:139-1941(+)
MASESVELRYEEAKNPKSVTELSVELFRDLVKKELNEAPREVVGSKVKKQILKEINSDHIAPVRLCQILLQLRNPNDPDAGGTVINEGPPEIDAERLIMAKNPFAKGAFGKVFHGSLYDTTCAVKQIPLKEEKDVMAEIRIMHQNHHPNILGLMAVAKDDRHVYLVMPLMSTNLKSFLRGKGKTYSPIQRCDFFSHILKGINWLHNQNPAILHLDIKAENILLDEHNIPKIADFGLSVYGETVLHKTTVGNMAHMAPEIMKVHPFGPAADVYGLGVLLWEVMIGYEWELVVEQQAKQQLDRNFSLKDSAHMKCLFNAIKTRNFRPPMSQSQNWPRSFTYLLQRMWEEDPNLRPSLSTILEDESSKLYFPYIRDDYVVRLVNSKIENDELGREFWLKEFRENPEKEVPWNSFVGRFCKFFQLKAGTELLLEGLAIALNAESDGVGRGVTLDGFACVSKAFGPFERGTGTLESIMDVMKHPWMWTTIDVNSAVQNLQGQDAGTFLVRYSTQPSVPFAISAVTETPGKGKGIEHYRIFKTSKGNFALKVADLENRRFGSLVEVMEDLGVKDTLKLAGPNLKNLSRAQLLFMEKAENLGYVGSW